MHQSHIHTYKSSELLVYTSLYVCMCGHLYISLQDGCLPRYTVGLVSLTPFCLDTIQDFIVGTNTLPRRI